MSVLLALLKALPEILALLKMIDAKCKELKVENDVKKNIQAIHTTFANKDADALRKIFNS